MSSLTSILVATDLSAPARHAVQRAAWLAAEQGTSLTVMHTLSGSALEEARRWFGDRRVEQALAHRAQEELDELARELASTHGIQVTTRLTHGHAVDDIDAHGRELGASLLVVGAQGHGFVHHPGIGSTAYRLMQRAERPLLVVRHPPHERYRRVLVPVDLSDWSLPSARMASRIAPQAQCVLLHVVAAPFESQLRYAGVTEEAIQAHRQTQRHDALQRLAELVRSAGLEPARTRTLVPDGPGPSTVWTQIIEQERELACDLVVIGKHGRHALEDLLLGSTTNVVLREGTADLLVTTRPA